MRPRPLGGLSGVQRDLLVSIAVNPGSDRRELQTAVEQTRQNTMADGTIPSNLDELLDYGLVKNANPDGDENEYRLTPESRELLDKEVEWLDSVR